MIIFLYGADTYRSRRFLQGLKDKFLRDVDPDASSLSVIDGSGASLKEIGEKINTGSLFVKKRFIVIDNIFKSKKEKIFDELNEYLKKFGRDEDNIMIFRDEELNTKNKPLKAAAKKLFAFLAKQPYSQEFSALNNSQLLSFIKKEAETYGRTISLPAATRLIGLTNGDLWLIASEIRKLSFRAETKDITLAEVTEMVVGQYDENIFGLTDALSSKNRQAAMGLLEEQYAAGLSEEYLLTMLTRQFKILLQIRESLDNNISPNDIAAELKLHPFVAKKGIMQARNFTGAALKGYLNKLINLDFLNKTGRGDIKTELALLISGL